jgi:hypothetical protein
MSDLLAKFHAQTRLRAKQSLIDKWEWEARWRGEGAIKQQAAQAKRVATALKKSCESFLHLDAEQQLSFRAAADGMRRLAADLDQLAIWAKAYFKFCETARAQERAATLAAFAKERWGDDHLAFAFEKSLLLELRTKEGQQVFGRWVQSCGHFSDLDPMNICTPFESFPSLANDPSRDTLAEFLQKSSDSMRERSLSGFGYGHSCFADYEAYLAYRKDVSSMADQLIEGARLGQ